jgi:hypothetical protein
MTSFPVPLPAEVKTRRFPPPWVIEDHNDACIHCSSQILPLQADAVLEPSGRQCDDAISV